MQRQNRDRYISFLMLDIVCLAFSFVFAYYLRHGNLSLFYIDIYKDMFFICILIDIILFFFLDPFEDILRRGYLVELKKTLLFDIVSLLLVSAYLFVVKAGSLYSRVTLALTYFFYSVSSYLTRCLLKRYIRIRSKQAAYSGDLSLLIICKNKEAETVVEKIKKNNFEFYQISGICVLDKNLIGEEIGGHKVVADKKNLVDYISSNWIDEIFISDISAVPKPVTKQLALSGIPIHIKIDEIEEFNDRVQLIDNFFSYNTVAAIRREYGFVELFLKRMMDIAGGIIGCLITLVLVVTVGSIIYIKSPGNIFYVSDRVGKNGKLFKFYKFRSMILNADDLKEDLKDQNRVKDGMMFKIENDPRIIPGIGHFIRKTSLDEFPQFYNVLKGDMSLVGTRPPTIDEWQKYSPYYRSRLTIKPGITGLWQISGRSEITDFDEVVRLDNEYINKWSLDLDIKILFKTIFKFLKGDSGAM